MRKLFCITGRLLPVVLLATAIVIAGCSSNGESAVSGGDSSASSSSASDSPASSSSASSSSASSRENSKESKWPAMEALASIGASDIASVRYMRNSEGGVASGSITDQTQIEDVYLRLKEVSIAGESDMTVLDDELVIKLETSGKSLGFSFEGDILLLDDGNRYDVENLSSLKKYIDGLIAADASPAVSSNSSGEPGNEAGNSNGGASAGVSEGPETSSNSNSSTGGTTSSSDYDVSKGFSKTTSSDGSIEYVYFNDFMMVMPGNEKWSFEMNGDSVTFYLFSAQQEGYGGRLVTIKAFDLDDDSYEQLPSYHVAGVGNNVNKRFVAIYPTDVQWNGADSTQDADYRDLSDYLWKIGEGAVNSPLQISDSD